MGTVILIGRLLLQGGALIAAPLLLYASPLRGTVPSWLWSAMASSYFLVVIFWGLMQIVLGVYLWEMLQKKTYVDVVASVVLIGSGVGVRGILIGAWDVMIMEIGLFVLMAIMLPFGFIVSVAPFLEQGNNWKSADTWKSYLFVAGLQWIFFLAPGFLAIGALLWGLWGTMMMYWWGWIYLLVLVALPVWLESKIIYGWMRKEAAISFSSSSL